MARPEQESLTKVSSKFESFLKRTLPETDLERIRGYEACIVNKNFKYIVLSDEYVYLTENPPKSIQESIPLQNVQGIKLIDDYPDFLPMNERLNTMHIQLTYHRQGSTRSSKLAPTIGRKLSKTRSDGSLVSLIPPPEGSAADFPSEGDPGSALGSSLDESSWRDAKSSPRARHSSEKQGDSAVPGILTENGSGSSGKKKQGRGKGSSKKVKIHESAESLESSPRGEGDQEENSELLHYRKDRASSANERRTGRSYSSDSARPLSGLRGELDEKSKKRVVVADIYMIKANSNMFILIKIAAENYLLRSTLLLDEEYSQRVQLSTSGRSTQQQEKVEQLFLQLSKELLEPSNTMEEVFGLLHELRVATEKNFSLKKLFWKTPDLLLFCIGQLQKYLPMSPCKTSTVEADRARRADEFELINLLIETLCLMFREGEIFPGRLRSLQADNSKATSELIEAITCFPSLPQRYKPPTEKAARLLMSTQTDKWNCRADAELHELYMEFGHSSTALLYELFLIAGQANWGYRTTSSFSVCWLVNLLERLNTTEKFLERVVSQTMKFIQPSKRVQLTPGEALLVLQQFTILHTVMSYSPRLAMTMRDNYTEEFKYYVQEAVLLEKLPPHYPTTASTLELIAEVMSAVLQKKCTFPNSEQSHGLSLLAP